MHLKLDIKGEKQGKLLSLLSAWDTKLQNMLMEILAAKGSTVFINNGEIRVFKKDGEWRYSSDAIRISPQDLYKAHRADKSRMHSNPINRSLLKIDPYAKDLDQLDINKYLAVMSYLTAVGYAHTEFAPKPPDRAEVEGA
jgi:hypothetical protein